MDFGAIINRAYHLVRNSNVLWKLGLLAVFTEGMVNGIAQTLPSPDFPGSNKQQADLQLQQALGRLEQWFTSHLALVAVISVVMIVLGVLLWYVSLRAKAGLIITAEDLEDNKPAGNFAESFKKGAPFAWRLLGLYWLVALSVIIAVGLVAAKLFIAHQLSTTLLVVGLVLLLPALFIFVIYMSFLMKMAERHIVLKRARVWESLSYGHKILTTRFVNSLLALLIEFGLGILFVIAVFAVVVVAVGLGALVLLLLSALLPQTALAVIAILLMLALLVGIFMLSGWFAAFQITYWTLVYRALSYMVGNKEKLTSN